MADMQLDTGEALLVASRGATPTHGLYRWTQSNGRWTGKQLATVKQLSALALHPSLPVVYGTSGMGQEGSIHAWRLDGSTASPLGDKLSDGAEPCHLVVDPSGVLLIVTNYTSSTLGIQNLAADGSFDGPIELIKLSGGGPEADRQDDAHPHQVIFHDGVLFVVDLGAEVGGLVERWCDERHGVAILTHIRAGVSRGYRARVTWCSYMNDSPCMVLK